MSDSIPPDESDFSTKMKALVHEAEQQMEEQGVEISSAIETMEILVDKKATSLSPQGELFPLPENEEGFLPEKDQSTLLEKLERLLNAQEGLPHLLNEVKLAIERKNTVSKSMFDALYLELKSYKDAFVHETVLKPVIHDLIVLYDDVMDIHRHMKRGLEQFRDTMAGASGEFQKEVDNHISRVEHHLHHLLEVLERLHVMQMPEGYGKVDKMSQKVVALEPAGEESEDQSVAKIVKRGFLWRNRVFRPEEVVIKRWNLKRMPDEAEQ